MPQFVPKEGQWEMTRVLLGVAPQVQLFVGLFGNTRAEIETLGLDITLNDIARVSDLVGTGIVNGEYQFNPADWSVPTGGQLGNPATHPAVLFQAPTGGAAPVGGYYVRSSSGVLWLVGLHPDVEAGGDLKQMPQGAEYLVNPSLDTESPE